MLHADHVARCGVKRACKLQCLPARRRRSSVEGAMSDAYRVGGDNASVKVNTEPRDASEAPLRSPSQPLSASFLLSSPITNQ